ncbi:hypothetical protein AB0K00_57035 [Dactylosporangium sp. NPDC049525]|uniref:hypothetical protein n=1 Tax=Dactylosporangium sp. NPDC049525 TaxID=3154730 RepID=UPI00341D7906
MNEIAGLPFWEVRFDADGDVDAQSERDSTTGIVAAGITDLLVFAHGWNNDADAANALYRGYFTFVPGLLAGRLPAGRKVGLLGVYWPSKRWSDEPAPDFAADLGAGGGAAGFAALPTFPPPPPPDEQTREALLDAFPNVRESVIDDLVGLLRDRPDDLGSLRRAHHLIAVASWSQGPGGTVDDGDGSAAVPPFAQAGRDGKAVSEEFLQALEEQGVVTSGAGGDAGFGDGLRRLWHGTQEAARQATYWQMKRRAGEVGERGLGPYLARLHAAAGGLSSNLIGHSFGARLVSFALRSMSGQAGRVRSVTLLQGAFSHYAFAAELPFDKSRGGGLRGLQSLVAGPVVACYSQHDSAVGVFYPLASLASGQDESGFGDPMDRWRGMGADGHQPPAVALQLQPAGTSYTWPPDGKLVSIDAQSVVRHGRPPSGAHSDICHAELAWIPLSAGGVIR